MPRNEEGRIGHYWEFRGGGRNTFPQLYNYNWGKDRVHAWAESLLKKGKNGVMKFCKWLAVQKDRGEDSPLPIEAPSSAVGGQSWRGGEGKGRTPLLWRTNLLICGLGGDAIYWTEPSAKGLQGGVKRRECANVNYKGDALQIKFRSSRGGKVCFKTTNLKPSHRRSVAEQPIWKESPAKTSKSEKERGRGVLSDTPRPVREKQTVQE